MGQIRINKSLPGWRRGEDHRREERLKGRTVHTKAGVWGTCGSFRKATGPIYVGDSYGDREGLGTTLTTKRGDSQRTKGGHIYLLIAEGTLPTRVEGG